MKPVSVVLLVLALTACGKRQQSEVDPCYVQSPNGQRLFLESVKCMGNLPQKEIAGFWRLGYESSSFFKEPDLARSIAIDLERQVHLMWDPKETPQLSAYQWPEHGPRVFRIRFIGSESFAPGYYGNGGGAGAVFVRKVLEINEVHD
jgi:hypothetical protein